jgi:hypothetical protein
LLGQLAGTYSGTFSGDDQGTWMAVVDTDGTITGSGMSDITGTGFDVFGNVTSSGDVNFVAGVVTTGSTFSGTVALTGEISGTWENEFFGESGTWSGSKEQ